MSQSYNQIIQRNKLFQKAHHSLKGFGNGLFSEAILHNKVATFKYPLMFMEDLPGPLSSGVETFVFRVHFMAPVAPKKPEAFNAIFENPNEVKSNMKQIAKDFLAFWVQDHDIPTLNIDKVVTATLFEDETEDRLTGCYIDITFRQPFTYNVCAIPVDGVPPPPTSTCDDATYKNSDSSFIQAIASGATFVSSNIIVTINGNAQPSSVTNKDLSFTVAGEPVSTTMNTDPLTDTPAGDTKDFTIVDQDDNTVVVTEVSDSANAFKGSVVIPGAPLNTSDIYLDGQTTSYRTGDNVGFGRGSDWWNLGFNNGFGENGKRFTGVTGGYQDELDSLYYDVDGVATTEALAFPDDIMLDWGQWDQVGETVFGINMNVNGAVMWDAFIDAVAALTYATYSDWIPMNKNVIAIMSSDELDGGAPRLFNYAPMKYQITAQAERLWTKTTGGITSRAYHLVENGGIQNTNKTSNASYIDCRIFTYANLGI